MPKPKASPPFDPAKPYSDAAEVRRDGYLDRVTRGKIKVPGVPVLETED